MSLLSRNDIYALDGTFNKSAKKEKCVRIELSLYAVKRLKCDSKIICN